MKLWKYNRITGYWALAKVCDKENAEAWLHIFQNDEPIEAFILSKHKPAGKPVFPNYMYALGIA